MVSCKVIIPNSLTSLPHIYIFIAIALYESIFLDVLHFPNEKLNVFHWENEEHQERYLDDDTSGFTDIKTA